MQEKWLVSLGHKKKRGKDEVAKHMRKYNFERYAIADELKHLCMQIYDLSYEQCWGSEKEVVDIRYGITPRQILQEFGQEQCARCPSIWCKILGRKILKNVSPLVVVTDMRKPEELYFLSEFAFTHRYRFVSIRIDRDLPADEFSNHISETALDHYEDWDLIIKNESTIAKLQEQIDTFLHSINISK